MLRIEQWSTYSSLLQEVHWLSKGNVHIVWWHTMPSKIRSSNLFDELKWRRSVHLYMQFANEKCIHHLAYLSDFSESINLLNLKLQGQKTVILKSYDPMKGFLEKISLWQSCPQSSEPNFLSFPRLNDLGGTQNLSLNLKSELKNLISEHLYSWKPKLDNIFHIFLQITRNFTRYKICSKLKWSGFLLITFRSKQST